jgi:Uma2 family endonuclease
MTTVAPARTLTMQTQLPGNWNLVDLQNHLGGIPLERIRLFPPPGYATAQDVTDIHEQEDRLYELTDGILVEKTLGWYESLLAGLILTRLNVFLDIYDLGLALGADGMLKMLPGMIRIPDVSFIRWERLPAEPLPHRPIPELVPDLAVEVLAEGNTEAEMQDKLELYFQAGVRLVWYVDPQTRSAKAYTSLTEVMLIDAHGILHGGDVLPGFQLSLPQLFATADRRKPT